MTSAPTKSLLIRVGDNEITPFIRSRRFCRIDASLVADDGGLFCSLLGAFWVGLSGRANDARVGLGALD
jgi:hypothetical protein